MSQEVYEQKLAACKSLIETFNQAAPEEKRINFDKFRDELIRIGGVSDEALKEVSWEDLGDLLVANESDTMSLTIPRLLAKQIAKVFRSKADPEPGYAIGGDISKIAELLTPVTSLSDDELIEKYSVSQPNGPAAKELKSRYGVKPILVFDIRESASGVFDKEATKKHLAMVAEGLPVSSEYYVYPDGTEVPLLEVGKKLDVVLEICPIHKSTLQSGRCSQCRQPWTNISLKTKQLVAIATELGLVDSDPAARAACVGIYSTATLVDGFGQLSKLYPEALREFRNRERDGDLPKLVSRVQTSSEKSSNPFKSGHRSF